MNNKYSSDYKTEAMSSDVLKETVKKLLNAEAPEKATLVKEIRSKAEAKRKEAEEKFLASITPRTGASIQAVLRVVVQEQFSDIEKSIAEIRNGVEAKEWRCALDIGQPLSTISDKVNRLKTVLHYCREVLDATSTLRSTSMYPKAFSTEDYDASEDCDV